MKKISKKLITILLVLFVACKLFAVDGIVTFVKGKVEVKRNNTWVSLKVGDRVKQSEVINTGFQSEAKVKLMNNVLYLGPVTRVTLSTLATDDEKDKVNVFLSTGTVRSKVNRSDTRRVSYTVRTPIAVASVRGTDVVVTSGNDVFVVEGKVSVNFIEAEKQRKKKAMKKALKEEAKEESEELENDENIDNEEDLQDEKDQIAIDLKEKEEAIDNLSDDELLEDFETNPELSKSGTLLTKDTGINLSNNTPISAPKPDIVSKVNDIMSSATDTSAKESVKSETPIVKQEVAKPEPKLTTGGINVGVEMDTGDLEVDVRLP